VGAVLGGGRCDMLMVRGEAAGAFEQSPWLQ
jgi:hypothetical protein